MTKAKANDIEIEYETFGNPSDKPLLLIMGLGDQMSSWDEDFIKSLTDRGFFVIIFDNRDVGLSSKCEEAGKPDLMGAIIAFQKGESVEAPYSLDDMADDSVGLLDALDIEQAHICGVSVGGMIAQTIATQEAAEIFFLPVPPERKAQIENQVRVAKFAYGSGFIFNEERMRSIAAKSFDRSFYPPGIERQSLAIMVHGNMKEKLSTIKVPTLVIHGREDPLYPVECGKDTAEAIKGSELIIIEGMGHSLPPETWDQISDAIKLNASKA
ncbi:MAG: alpha/beta fold hydrolase [Promethearchaeota archaeon]|jgi:pimeloyl-ACP methyl ester carboxylesterase